MRENKIQTIAIIVAGGTGSRIESELPKQYVPFNNKTMLFHTLMAFLNHPDIDAVCVVIHPEHHHLYQKAIPLHPKLLPPIEGGKRRQDSVRLGLIGLEHYHPTHVLIHDAARPFVSQELISSILHALTSAPAIIPVIPVKNTIKIVQNNVVISTPERKKLFLAQTPQGFFYPNILAAHQQHIAMDTTDDAQICELSHIVVKTIPGEERNIKITTAEDFLHHEFKS